MTADGTATNNDQLFQGGGELGELMRAFDWSKTPLGPVERWPQSLKTCVRIVLTSRQPMFVWWGESLINLYNDAYKSIVGGKHPAALGQPASVVWREIWDQVGPRAERAMRGNEGTYDEALLLIMERHGYQEETYYTFSYSPVPNEHGGTGGIICANTDDTQRIIGERRLALLRELAARTADARLVKDACSQAAAALATDPQDLPFALVFLIGPGSGDLVLAASSGITGAPTRIPRGGAFPWPLAEVLTTHEPRVIDDLSALPRLPVEPWGQPPSRAVAWPLTSSGQSGRAGVLVVGLNPFRPFDDDYRSFVSLVAGQISAGVANAQAYEEERRRAESLAEIDRAKTAFFSNVSHEFRTPLTLMLGPQEDALSSPQGALAGESLRAVHRNTLRLLKLVNNLLDFSRIEAGRAQAVYQPTNLASLTTDLASAFRSAIERGGVRFEVDCQRLPEPIYVDRAMWEKIVLNLLSNAFKFTFEGRIAVDLRQVGERVQLRVADSGVGIPEEELPRLFERFHRIEGTRARTHEGSGIGLALVHELVTLHGGTIAVESRPGQGTTFTITIPVGTAHLPADRILSTASSVATAGINAEPYVQEARRWVPGAEEPGSSGTDAGRVLVADDNADMRDYLARLLREHWTVETVSDGAEALAAARLRRPDLIITDVMMSNLDGFGLLAAVRGDPTLSRTPVIMLSARAGEESRVEGLDAGADDYLVKPFSTSELVLRVRSHLEKSRLRQGADAERRRLRSLLGQIPAIVNFLSGPELVIEFIHPMAVSALGGRELIGKPLLEAIPEFRDQEYPALLRKVFETGAMIDGREKLVLLDDGQGGRRESYWTFVYLPVRDENGRVEGVMTYDHEVTDQVLARRKIEEQAGQLAEAFQEAQRVRAVAESANRAKDEFLAMLGHELRNPLSPIVTALQLMRMRGAPSREQSVIERQVGHLLRLVDDLLDISRITRGRIELRKARVELREVVQRGLEIASPLFEQRRHRLEIQVPAEGLAVDADPERLAQVVSNLFTNAAKYSEPDTAVHVTASTDGTVVRLSVRDEGVGIAAPMLDRVFDVFYQQPQSVDRSKGGLGLGLAIVRSIVELHGGKVSARSDGPGRGSEFVVELPAAAALAAPAPSRDELLAGADALPTREGRARRVLVVDDNVDAAEALSELLASLGHEVRWSHDAVSALEAARAFHPEVCLLDIGLPVMDGYELAARLRQSHTLADGARIIAVTGYGQDGDRRRAREAGFDDHIVKPVSFEALTRALTSE